LRDGRGGSAVDGRLGAAANRHKADARALRLAPVMAEWQVRGLPLADRRGPAALGIQTQRDGNWTAAAA
jgi:hypothetical protein